MRLFTLLIFIAFPIAGTAQQQQINWLSDKELSIKFSTKQKPILLFFHTSWCKYCKMQENTTFQDSTVISELNKNFYVIQIDAEKEETIYFFGREYHFNSQEKLHDLVIYLGKKEGKIEFPTAVLLNEQLEPIFHKSSFIDSKELLSLIKSK